MDMWVEKEVESFFGPGLGGVADRKGMAPFSSFILGSYLEGKRKREGNEVERPWKRWAVCHGLVEE